MTELIVRNRNDITSYLEKNQRNTPRTGALFAIAMTSVFADAYDLGSLSIGVNSMANELGLTPTQVGIATASTAFGALASALLGGIIADRTGRYRLFIVCAVILVVAPLGIALSVNFWMLLAFRILLGIAVGLDLPVAFSFMAELLPKDTSAKFINFWQPVSSLANIAGVAVALPFAIAMATEHLWRFSVGLGSLIALATLILRLMYSEESPEWSAKHQKLETAAKVLSTAYNIDVRVEPDGTGEGRPALGRRLDGVRQLFNSTQIPKTILVTICGFVQQLQYYGVGFYVPVITGLIFGEDLVSTIVATICAQGLAMVAGLIGVRLTTRLGLRRIGVIGYFVVVISLVSIALIGVSDSSASLLPVVLVALMLAATSFGPGPLSKTLAAVVYPTEIRGAGTGWGETAGRLGSVVGLLFFPVVLEAVGIRVTMLIIAVFPIVAIVALLTIRWDRVATRAPRYLSPNVGDGAHT